MRSTPGQVAVKCLGDCLWTGKPSRYITNYQGQLSLPSSVVYKLSNGLSGWVKAVHRLNLHAQTVRLYPLYRLPSDKSLLTVPRMALALSAKAFSVQC